MSEAAVLKIENCKGGEKDAPASLREPFDARREAMRLYFRGFDCQQIAEELNVNYNTVRSWCSRDKWDQQPYILRTEQCLFYRFNKLCDSPVLKPQIKADIDFIGKQIERMARVRRSIEPGGHEGDLNPKVANRNAGPKKVHKQNYISAEHKEKIIASIKAILLAYQKNWVDAGIHRNRFILKSRQIGATMIFALESLLRALETGFNQIFISASRSQANIFKQYIVDFVYKITGVRLKGDPMLLEIEGMEERPQFFFLGTNFRTVQGYHGDIYIDEVFWIYGFAEIKKVAGGCATHEKYRKTYFSTPSTITHEAYKTWIGEDYNKKRAKENQVQIDIKSDLIKKGHLYSDRMWRNLVTVHDAVRDGANFFNIEELREEHTIDDFRNLFECEFIDDSQSSFPLSLIQPCMIDSWEKWKGYNPFALNQKSLGPAWISCDPSHSAAGDPAAIMVVLPPEKAGGKFRLVEKLKFRGLAFEKLADEIKKLCAKYDVKEVIIDRTGMGEGVFQLVLNFFPLARGVLFNAISKSQLVYKGQSVFRAKRMEIDAGSVDVAGDLMSIHPKITKGQGQVSYDSRRSSSGHGEYGWGLLLALSLEPMDGESGRARGFTMIGSE